MEHVLYLSPNCSPMLHPNSLELYLILIGHDHDATVAQSLEVICALVLLLVLQAHDFNQLVDFFVFHDLQTGISKVVKYSNHLNTGHPNTGFI